jgi:E3 ubiquitin-protein ligase SHPRH
MLVTTSQYTESLPKNCSGLRRWGIGVLPIHSALHVSNLTSLIEDVHHDKSITSGNKRPAPSSTSSHSAKRLKQSTSETLDSERVPILRHTFNVRYTSEDPGSVDEDADLSRLVQLLKQFTSNIEPQTLSLGDFTKFDVHEGRLFIELGHNIYDRDWLLLIPPLFNDIDDDAHDLDIGTKDLMLASHILYRHDRVCIECSLKLVVLPPGLVDSASELPFYVQLQMTISLNVPQIFNYDYRYGLKKVANEIEDAQRRLLSYVFPATVPPSECASKIDIPFFYSALKPAPKLSTVAAENAMQPSGLLPSLLPFQKRSVGWLLEREGKNVDEKGSILSKPAFEKGLPMFWEKIEREEPWYFNRLTGDLSDDMPVEGDVPPGGILAEEPGLGKTLECISLILLNPRRKPSVQRWDGEAKIHVNEIKVGFSCDAKYQYLKVTLLCHFQTTLIVTPSSLASQWASELALHAPSLKVFIYDGWAKTNVPAQRNKAKKDASDNNDSYSRRDRGDWCSYINTFDVCITTYNILQQEFNVARAPPDRPRREDVIYSNIERPRSPLIMCEWYRVIMDEVQMVGGGNAE